MGIFADIPADLGVALGISPENAALLLSCAILVSLALSIVLVGKKFNLIGTAVPMVATMGFLVAVGWLPYWVLLILGLFIATQFGLKMRDAFGGN